MAEEILIDFKVNTDELTSAQAQLKQSGKVDSSTLDLLNKKLSTTNKEAKGLAKEFNTVRSSVKMLGDSVNSAFEDGMLDALKEAGLSMEEFDDMVSKASQPVKSLKTELKELKLALAEAKVNGTDFGEEFNAMRQRAGELQDAIMDANAEIKNVASDTRNMDNVIGTISAMAGAFSLAQGAAALLGDENEDMQKVLVKLNSVMAISQGIQQIQNALQKEGAITKLADVVSTNAQVAAQRIYTAVTGKATAATVGFKVALAATGIGVFVLAVVALYNALDDTADSLEEVNGLLEQQNYLLENSVNFINRRARLQEQLAKEGGAAESELLKIRGEVLTQEYEIIRVQNERLRLEQSSVAGTSEAWFALNEQLEKNLERQREIRTEVDITNSQIRVSLKQEAEDRKKLLEEEAKKAKEAAEKRAQLIKEQRLADLNDGLAALERQLLQVEKNTQEEVNIRKKIIEQKSKIELEADKLTANQKKLIQEQALQDQIDLQEKFNVDLNNKALEMQIKQNEAVLAGIELTEEERLRVRLENINAAAQIERNLAIGNAQAIEAIEAKRDQEIRELKNESIRINLERELEAEDRKNRRILAGLNKLAADQEANADARLTAVIKAMEIEIAAINLQLEANEKLEQSEEDRLRNREKLLDDINKAEEEAADRMLEINEQTTEKLKEENEKRRDAALAVMGEVLNFVSFLNQQASEQEQQRLNDRQKEIDSLLESGAITEKEAERRRKKLELEEKKLRQRQAERQKQEAVFQALLGIPQAWFSGMKTGGLPLAIIYAALAAAQAGVIAARPVPKFFRGKKDTFSGMGEVGDMGAELVQRKGGFELYTQPTLTHLGRYDKVYTAAETRAILDKTNINITKDQNGYKFDYEKLAKMMPKSKDVSINIDKGFIEESVANGLLKNRYFDNRYKFN